MNQPQMGKMRVLRFTHAARCAVSDSRPYVYHLCITHFNSETF